MQKVTENDLKSLDYVGSDGITRRRFVRGALTAALAAPLLADPIFMRSAVAANYKGKTLRFMMANPHAGSGVILAAAWVELTGGAAEMVKTPMDTMTANATLDVTSGSNNFDVFQYWYADKAALWRDKVMLDITSRVDRDAAEIDPSDFISALYDSYTLCDGKRVGLPLDGDSHILYYNEEILARNGLKPPSTWDDYQHIIETVTKAESAKGVYGAVIMGKQQPIILCSAFANRLAGFGGEFLNENGKSALSSEASVGAAKALLKAAPFALPTPLEIEFGNAIPAFLAGKGAMIEFWTDMGTWCDDPAQSKIVGKWNAVPMLVGGSNARHVAALNAGFGFAVSAGTKEPDMAYDFVKMSALPKTHMKLILDNHTGIDPVRKSEFASGAYKSHAPKQAAAVEDAITHALAWPTKANSPQLFQALTDELGFMLAGQKTAEQSIESAHKTWESMLA